jgi:hypothetical protein
MNTRSNVQQTKLVLEWRYPWAFAKYTKQELHTICVRKKKILWVYTILTFTSRRIQLHTLIYVKCEILELSTKKNAGWNYWTRQKYCHSLFEVYLRVHISKTSPLLLCRWINSHSSQQHTLAAKQIPSLSIGLEDGWAPEPVWMLNRREKSCPCRESTPGCSACSPSL